MHLAGQADGLDVLALRARGFEHALDGFLRGVPPIARVLFRPAGTLHRHLLMRSGEARHEGAFFVDEQRAAAAGANVDS